MKLLGLLLMAPAAIISVVWIALVIGTFAFELAKILLGILSVVPGGGIIATAIITMFFAGAFLYHKTHD